MKINRLSKSARWNRQTNEQSKWTLWFAWKPVQITDDKVAWLERVYRRADDPYMHKPKWKYKSREEFFVKAMTDAE